MGPLSDNLSFEDSVCVKKVQAGEIAAFEELVIRYQDRVYNLCVRMVGNAENARDLAQETFLKAFQAIGRFEHKSSFYTWLFRIAVNVTISERRKNAKIRLYSLSGDDGEPGAEVHVHQAGQALKLRSAVCQPGAEEPSAELRRRETKRAVLEALERLDEDQRAVLVLRDVEALDYEAIAAVLEVPVGTVRSRLHRARLAMKELLKPMIMQVG